MVAAACAASQTRVRASSEVSDSPPWGAASGSVIQAWTPASSDSATSRNDRPAQEPKSHSPGASPETTRPARDAVSRARSAGLTSTASARGKRAASCRGRDPPARVERLIRAEGSGSHRVGGRVANEQQPAGHRER